MIIVLTPVKNEEWILEQFLTVTSLFADCIIIADQHSSDNSKNICLRFPKVKLIENKNSDFNEAERQILLIETARNLFPNDKKIFFCLDADEIITGDSLERVDTWKRIRSADPGTAFYFEKPEMLPGLKKCARWRSNFAPLACVDDNSAHKPKEIHSYRIPSNFITSNKTLIDDIKFMHFAHTRINVQSAKYRFYSIIENIKNINPVYLRRYNYQSFFDLIKRTSIKDVEITPPEWIGKYDLMNINLRNLPDPEFSWHDFEALKLFSQHGYRRFKWDNIWEFDWEKCRLAAIKRGITKEQGEIKRPSFVVRLAGRAIDISYIVFRYIKRKI